MVNSRNVEIIIISSRIVDFAPSLNHTELTRRSSGTSKSRRAVTWGEYPLEDRQVTCDIHSGNSTEFIGVRRAQFQVALAPA